MKNGAAITIRGGNAEILSSLEEYHAKYEVDTSTWSELTNEHDKKEFYDANAAALKKIKLLDIETVVEAAQRREAAEKRKSLWDSFVGLKNDLLNAVVSFPLVVFVIWGLSFGLERYSGLKLSHFQTSALAVVGTVCIFKIGPRKPGRGTFVMAAIGYLLIILFVWMFD